MAGREGIGGILKLLSSVVLRATFGKHRWIESVPLGGLRAAMVKMWRLLRLHALGGELEASPGIEPGCKDLQSSA